MDESTAPLYSPQDRVRAAVILVFGFVIVTMSFDILLGGALSAPLRRERTTDELPAAE